MSAAPNRRARRHGGAGHRMLGRGVAAASVVVCAAVIGAAAAADTRPTTTDAVNVGDAAAVYPPAGAASTDAVTFTDTASVLPPVTIGVVDGFTASDSVSVVPPTVVAAADGVAASDQAGVVPPTVVAAADRVAASDQAEVVPPAIVAATDAAHFADTAGSAVVNTPPKIGAVADATSSEGSALTATVSFKDPDPQTWTATVDYGDGSGAQSVPVLVDKTIQLSHVYTDNRRYTVTVEVTDSTGASASTTFAVDVANVAPTATVANDGPVAEGSPATISLSSPSDPSPVDSAAGFTYAFACDGVSYGAAQAQPTAQCTFDDGPSTHAVLAKIVDKDGVATEYTTQFDVTNVAPTATLGNGGPVVEGSPATITFSGQSDPSAADTAAGFTYEVACDGSTYVRVDGPSSTCIFDDGPSTHVVLGRISDKDGGSTKLRTTVDVTNAPPTGTLVGPAVVDEGSAVTLSVPDAADPSYADTAAAFGYRFACDGVTFTPASSFSSSQCTFDDGPSTHTMRAQVIDKDGGTTTLEKTIEVRNVAPTATFTAPAPVDEGSQFMLALGSPQDPSAADAAAGFTYAFDCGDGSGPSAFGTDASRTCPTDDNGTRAVVAAVRDKDGGITTYTGSADVRSVAPTAMLVPLPASVAEGGSFTVALTAPYDRSSRDMLAGFTYAFDCGAGYGPATTTVSATCRAVDEGLLTVRARIADKDGAAAEYTATTTVANVAPTTAIVTPAAQTVVPVGTAVSFAGTFTDPGVLDTHTATWSFDSTTVPGVVTETGGSGSTAAAFTFTAAGVYTVSLAVTDDDGGVGTATRDALVVATNPGGGFVTNGGWVAHGPGKTTFGGNAKYDPHGVVQGSLTATGPGMSFASTAVDWLVVAGSRVAWHGTGTYNGAPGYTFLVDEWSAPDRFRLIVRAPGGGVVYDDVPGAPEDLDAAAPLPLGGGSIVVHR